MIYRLEYKNKHGDTARIDIRKGAATPVHIVEGTENPFQLSYELEDKSKKGFVMSSFADISLFEDASKGLDIDSLKTSNETELSAKWYINNVLNWSGFVVPDFFSREIGTPAVINLTASDRLSSLKDATLGTLTEYITLKNLAIACLEKTGQTLPLNHTVDFTVGDWTNVMDAKALSERLKDDKGKSVSCYDILRSILVLTNSTIRQRNGQWTIYNKIQHEALAPSTTFDEVYQGAKRTIQPVFSSVGAFQEFGGLMTYPKNHSFDDGITGWTAVDGFVTEFDNRELIYTSPILMPVFGEETQEISLINRNTPSPGLTPALVSNSFHVPFDDSGSARLKFEMNTNGAPSSFTGVEVIRTSGTSTKYLNEDGSWSKKAKGIYSRNPALETGQTYGSVDNIIVVDSTITLDDGEVGENVTLTIKIYGVGMMGGGVNMPMSIRSVKVNFQEKSDAKGILYRTEQLGDFSKKNDPETTIFGDYLTSGLNGYFYPYSKDDTSILYWDYSILRLQTRLWTTSTDPTAGKLPILQHVSRQVSRMFGVAHDMLSAVIDARNFDPLHIISNCKGEKYVVVSAQYDFLRSTVEVELEQIAYGSLQRRDFIYSYFGGGNDDGVSSIGSASNSSSSSSGGAPTDTSAFTKRAEAEEITGDWTFTKSIAINRDEAFGSFIRLNRNNVTKWLIHGGATSDSDVFSISNAANESKLSVTLDGRVGINNVAPSQALDINGNIALSGGIMRKALNAGHLIGGHNNVGSSGAASNPIFTLGTNFNPEVGTLGDMYGIGYTNSGTASFLTTVFPERSGWGMYVAAAGTARIFLNGSNGDIRNAGVLQGQGTFVSGFAGSNWQLNHNIGNNKSQLTVDNLVVRNSMTIYELVINKIRATNGSLWVSDSLRVDTATLSGTNWVIKWNKDTNRTFVIGDIVKAQQFDGRNVREFLGRVVTYWDPTNEITISKISGDNPWANMDLVRVDSSEAGRDGALYLTASDRGSPYMDVTKGNGNGGYSSRLRVGKLNGIGGQAGYGIWGSTDGSDTNFVISTGQGATPAYAKIANINFDSQKIFTDKWFIHNNGSFSFANGLIRGDSMGNAVIDGSLVAKHITAQSIEGLDLNFTKGKIGGFDINANSIGKEDSDSSLFLGNNRFYLRESASVLVDVRNSKRHVVDITDQFFRTSEKVGMRIRIGGSTTLNRALEIYGEVLFMSGNGVYGIRMNDDGIKKTTNSGTSWHNI